MSTDIKLNALSRKQLMTMLVQKKKKKQTDYLGNYFTTFVSINEATVHRVGKKNQVQLSMKG